MSPHTKKTHISPTQDAQHTIRLIKRVVGIFIALNIVLVGGYFLFQQRFVNQQSSASLYRYIPDTFDQVVILHPAQAYDNSFIQSQIDLVSPDIQRLGKDIDTLIVAQRNSGLPSDQLLLIKHHDTFDTQAFLALLMSGNEVQYVPERLGDDLVAIGRPDLIATLDTPTTPFFTGQSIAKLATADKAAISLFSRVDSAQATALNPFVGSSLTRVDIFGMHVFVADDTISVDGYLLYHEPLSSLPSRSFRSQFSSHIDTHTIAYIETADVLSLLGVDPQNVAQLLALGGQQYDTSASLSSDDYAHIARLLSGSIGLMIQDATHLLGIGGALFFDDVTFFPVAQKLIPLLTPLLQQTGMVGGTSPWETVQENSRVGVVNDSIPGGSILFDTTDDTTRLLVGSPTWSTGDSLSVGTDYPRESIATFYIHIGKVLDVYTTVMPLLAGGSVPPLPPHQLSFFSDKIMHGYLALHKESLDFHATISPHVK